MAECETAARALRLADVTAVDDGHTSGTSSDPHTATTGSREVIITSSSIKEELIQELASLMTSASVRFKRLCLDLAMPITFFYYLFYLWTSHFSVIFPLGHQVMRSCIQ